MNYLADMLIDKTHYLKDFNGQNVTVNSTKLSLINYFTGLSLKTKNNKVYCI